MPYLPTVHRAVTMIMRDGGVPTPEHYAVLFLEKDHTGHDLPAIEAELAALDPDFLFEFCCGEDLDSSTPAGKFLDTVTV